MSKETKLTEKDIIQGDADKVIIALASELSEAKKEIERLKEAERIFSLNIEPLKSQLSDKDKEIEKDRSSLKWHADKLQELINEKESLNTQLSNVYKLNEELHGIIKDKNARIISLSSAITNSLEIKSLWLPYSESCAPEHEGEAIALQNMHNQFIESLSTLNKTKEEPKVKEGDFIKGSWKDEATQKTYFEEGTVKMFPAGLFVENKDGGITPLKDFFHFSQITKEEGGKG